MTNTHNKLPTTPHVGLQTTAADHLRSACLGASAAAMILVPTLGPAVAGTEEGAEDFDTEITPPGYAFTIWAPIFIGVAANAIQHVARPATSVNRRTGWWFTGAYSANTLWSIVAQSNRFRYTPFILPVAALLALAGYHRMQHEELRGTDLVAAHSSGMLLGWTSVASVVNAFAASRLGQCSATTRTGRRLAQLAVASAAAAISAIIGNSQHGQTSLAAASGWALASNAANPQRSQHTRLINAAGTALILGVSGVRTLTTTKRTRTQDQPIPI